MGITNLLVKRLLDDDPDVASVQQLAVAGAQRGASAGARGGPLGAGLGAGLGGATGYLVGVGLTGIDPTADSDGSDTTDAGGGDGGADDGSDTTGTGDGNADTGPIVIDVHSE